MAKIPIDLNEIRKAVGAASDAQNTPVHVAVFVDQTASDELVTTVREAFAPVSTNAFLHIEPYFDVLPAISGDTDLAAIVAASSPRTGEFFDQLITASISTVVCCDSMPETLSAASAGGHPIDSKNIVSMDAANAASAKAGAGKQPVSGKDADAKPSNVKTPKQFFLYALGDWIVGHCRDKRIAFAAAFTFVRSPLATEITKTTALQNGVIGAALFIPGADMPVMTLNQMKMVLQQAAAYGQPIGIERAKELAVVLGGGFAFRAAARQVVGLVPALGWAVKAAIGYSGTIAMGYAARDYFESGGKVEGLAEKVVEARDAAVEQARKANEGAKAATKNLTDSVFGKKDAQNASASDKGAKAAKTASSSKAASGKSAPKWPFGKKQPDEVPGHIVIEPLSVEDVDQTTKE